MVNVRHDKLGADTFTFTGLQKQKLEGWDYACAEKFKAPMNNFKTKEDFGNWCQAELEAKTKLKQYKCKAGMTVYRGQIVPRDAQKGLDEINNEKMPRLREWKDYLAEKNNIYIENPAMSLMIFSGITEDVSAKNTAVPPILNKGVLADTVEQIQTRLAADKKSPFNFNKIYQNNLRTFAMKTGESDTGETETKWIKIPSKEHDPENFEKNVERLKMLSHDSWCTKSTNAEPYLEKGDFHIYLENGKPQAAIRLIGDTIEEIQGSKNNGEIPLKYASEIQNYINENQIHMRAYTRQNLQAAKKISVKFSELKSEIEPLVKNKNYDKILAKFGIETTYKDAQRILSKYKQPDEKISWSDLGITENDLLKNVVKIKGTADFSHSEATDLSSLKHIGKNADFTWTKVKDLSALEHIGGDAVFQSAEVKNLGSLKYIGGDAYFLWNKVKDLSGLEYIGRDAKFYHSEVTDLSRLKHVGRQADFSGTEVINLSSLKYVGEYAVLRNSKLTPQDFANVKVKRGIITSW
jgi:hypothetical protein